MFLDFDLVGYDNVWIYFGLHSFPSRHIVFHKKKYVALISWKFCLFTKACSHFSKENTKAILVSQVIQNYVGLSSSTRIRRSKSLAFVGRPTISVLLTLRSCDMRKQIMVIPHTFSPSRHSHVRWHAETNYGHSASFVIQRWRAL